MTKLGFSNDAAWYFLEECYKTEEQYKEMLLDGKTKYAILDNFNTIEEKLTGGEICKTLSSIGNIDGLRKRNISNTEC